MKKQGLIFYRSELWIIIICTLCIQLADFKIASIKISELILLLLLPFYSHYIFKSRITLYFLGFFLLFLLQTVVVNLFTNFYINDELPLLKEPYFISISRFIEMAACIVFCSFVFNGLKLSTDPYTLIKKLLFVQIFIFGIFYIAVYALYAGHLFHTTTYENLIVYDTSLGNMVYRLRGFYVEGGPLGLFYGFLFVLCVAWYKKLGLSPWYIVLCLVIIFLAGSKAGYMMIVMTGMVFFFSKVNGYIKKIWMRVVFYMIIAGFFIGTTYVVLQIYFTTFAGLEEQIAGVDPNDIDPNLMLGRISASVIYPNMLRDNYLKGIGWGNYPLLRNNPKYRDFMPDVPVSMWDATGFGGMADMLVEAGVPMFLLYLLIYYLIIKKTRKSMDNAGYIILALVGPLLLGVAIYFLYTWFILGVMIFFIQNPIDKLKLSANESSNEQN